MYTEKLRLEHMQAFQEQTGMPVPEDPSYFGYAQMMMTNGFSEAMILKGFTKSDGKASQEAIKTKRTNDKEKELEARRNDPKNAVIEEIVKISKETGIERISQEILYTMTQNEIEIELEGIKASAYEIELAEKRTADMKKANEEEELVEELPPKTSEIEIEEARAKYLLVFEKEVPNNMKNNLEWINKKLNQ